MGKSYVENSLKRFLKRKVKITLGVVVTFLITGAVSFAEINMPENKNENWLNGIGTEKTLENTVLNINDNGNTAVEVSNNTIIIKKGDKAKTEINLKNLSNGVYNNVKTSLELGKNALNSGTAGNTYVVSGTLPENYNAGLKYKDNVGNSLKADGNGKYSVIEAGTTSIQTVELEREWDSDYVAGQYAVRNGIVINKGIIEITAPQNKKNTIGQESDFDGIAINYGIIKNKGIGQRGVHIYNYGVLINDGQYGQWGTKYSYNYGIIANKGDRAQYGANSVEVKNYGILMNTGMEAQYIGKNSKGYNYGLINNGDGTTDHDKRGQSMANGGVGYNYGLIDVSASGQYTAQKGSLAENYGVIKVEKQGQTAEHNSEIRNYGIVASNEDSQVITHSSTGYNYGVLYNKQGNIISASYSNTTESYNYGILITEGNVPFNDNTSSRDTITNKGIVLKRDGDKLSVFDDTSFHFTEHKNVGEYTSGKIESGTENKSNDVFINNLGADKKTTVTEIDDNLSYAHITTAVTNDVGTVIKKDGDLTLNNSTIIGYFEKDGTLLNVDGELTLSGESVINAIAGNEYTGYTGDELKDVVAVKLTDNGTLTIKENSKVLGAVKGNGTLIYENIDDELYSNTQEVDSAVIRTTDKNTTDITLANLTLKDSKTGVENAGKLIIDNQSNKKLDGKEVSTTVTLANNINIEKGIDGSSSANGIELILGDGQTSSDKTINIDNITLGTGDDILTINNILGKVGEINGNGGNDTVNLKNSTGTHDTFDYKLKNIDTLDLGNSAWKIGANANISHDTITRADGKTTIQNGTLAGELKGTAEKGVEFVNNEAVNSVLGNSTFGDNAKFQMNIGKDMKLIAGAEYDIEDKAVENLKNNVGEKNITASAIFTKATEQGKDIRVKTAEEMKIDSRYSGIYEEMLENASSNSEILDTLNNSDVSSIANAVNGKGTLGDTLATTGYKITRDISNSFMSAVNEWGKKANKGEWLANAKYINSDVEYDGANKVKGYDSDIKSMVGMIEYGVSDNTSLGIALGGGDTEIDVKDAGTLKGDNYYIGAYAKHSVNGFDLTGNLGYTISDLEVNGEGSADSSAITLGGYIKRDIALTETVRLEPNLSFTYDYIMQDNAEGSGVKADNKDIHVFEAGAGMNIVKGFNFEKGLLELEAGVKYSMADVNRNEETVISVYGIDNINLGNPEIDKTRGTAHVGFDYEHTTGFGVNGKYEMMWSDSGDDSRITAGISYRF